MIALIGVGTVFLALVFLIAVLSLTERLIGVSADARKNSPGGGAGRESDPPVEPLEGAPGNLIEIAVAAYCVHKARRVAVRMPEPASAWLMEGRARQLSRG